MKKELNGKKTKHFIFNDLNYTVEIYISKTKTTEEFFHRFKKCKILGRSFEVQAVDDLSANGLLIVYLKEDYTNVWAQEENQESILSDQNSFVATIFGPKEVYPYDIVEYQTSNLSGGTWLLSNNRARILKFTDTFIQLEITTGKSGSIDLIYKKKNAVDIIFPIKILSL